MKVMFLSHVQVIQQGFRKVPRDDCGPRCIPERSEQTVLGTTPYGDHL